MKTAIDIVCPVCNVAPGIDCLPAGRTHRERFVSAALSNEVAGKLRDFGRAFFGDKAEKPKGPPS